MATHSSGCVILRFLPLNLNFFFVFFRTLIFVFFALWTSCNVHADSGGSRHRALSVEVMGRSILYGFQYDQRMSRDVTLGVGVSRIEVQESKVLSSNGSFLIPVFGHYYLTPQNYSFYLSAGMTVILQPRNIEGGHAILGSVRFSSLPILPNLGFGYELRQDQGFLFRVAALITQGESVALSSGFHLGYLF